MAQLTSKTSDTGLQKILVNYISDDYTAQKWLFSVVWESAGYLVHSFSKKEKRQQLLLQTAIFECLKTVSYLSFADEESIGDQCGFNKMWPLLIQRECPWLLFELHSLIMSFHVLEISHGLRVDPIFLCAVFICGDFWNHVLMLGIPAHLENWRLQYVKISEK